MAIRISDGYDFEDTQTPVVYTNGSKKYVASQLIQSDNMGNNDSYIDNGFETNNISLSQGNKTAEGNTGQRIKNVGVYTPYGYDDTSVPITTQKDQTTINQEKKDNAQDQQIAENTKAIENIGHISLSGITFDAGEF